MQNMIKDTTYNNANVSINTKEISILKEYFPSCFKKDGSFDLERFKEELKDKVDIVHEGYELKFLGKSYAKLLASLDTTTVITPNLEHNKLPENKASENIYISGDNLDGLKHLLKSYSKSVKCIYIDPPYNTGSDGFVYKDNFNFTADELQDKLSVDETQAKRILDLTKRDSASHSAWLMFMYARLQLAKDLLKDDGVIFISIDDNEQANLKLLCDDIFGEENFVASYIWESTFRPDNSSKIFRKNAENVICFCKSISNVKQLIGSKEGSDGLPSLTKSSMKESELFFNEKIVSTSLEDGIYKSGKKSSGYELLNDVEVKNGLIVNSFSLKGRMIWGQSYLENELLNGTEIIIKTDGFVPYTKKNSLSILAPNTIIPKEKVGDVLQGRAEVTALFDFPVFDYPKPTSLPKYLMNFFDEKDSIILDFFSGSATTSHAAMQLNAEDGGNRKFIAVQLPEVLDVKSTTQKNAFDFLNSIKRPTTLDYVGMERIIRASKKIKTETNGAFDFGFKHFILNEPSQNTLDKLESFSKASLLGDATILDDFGTETVLTTWLNNDGYGLNAKVETIDLKGYTAYYCKKHLYLINPNFTQEAMVILFEKYDTIAGFNPENIVLFGYSFNEWSITEMLEKNLKILNDSEKNLKINIDVRY